ncbi:MAG: hypothetical protein WBB98_03495 [Xanthobacteraceae bacterium]
MIKDRGQKKLAVRYCAAQGIVPFAEVLVRSSTSLEEAPLNITDIDVLGIQIGHFGAARRILFDCKTANKQSGINRALWVSGLRHLVLAEAGLIIQAKAVPDTHRLAASAMGINIHTEDSFRRYAVSLSPDFEKDISYLDDMDRWDELMLVGRQIPQLADLAFFVGTQAALERSGPKGLRIGLSAILRAAGELDPGKPVHRMLFGCVLSAFLLHIAMAVTSLKDVFDFSMPKQEFERRLRYFLWEGRENYELRLKLRRALSERGNTPGDGGAEFDLPQWSKLIELIRGYLEAPEALAQLAFIAKEIAFRSAAPAIKADADARIRKLFSINNRARQFIFSALNYLTLAGGLPREFNRHFEAGINELVG